MPAQTVYLNGQYLPVEQAQVSVMDRGFLLADGVYEVIPVYGGQPFRLTQHLQRLRNSLAGIRLDLDVSDSQWSDILNRLIADQDSTELSVYLQVTRGSAAKRDHGFPSEVSPTVFVMVNPIPPLDPKLAQQGIHAILLDDIRWQRCDIKAITLLANVLLRQQAHDLGAQEAILVRDNLALEGAASNLFVVDGSKLITPPKSRYVLPGITRDLVLELAPAAGLVATEQDIPAQSLPGYDEIWLTSSTKEIMPVTLLDDKVISKAKPGPVWQRMTQAYHDFKQTLGQDSCP
ncbi:MAG TPA: D-amino acid aminotransferase [Gammaproteobacteria bacterium]|nr:D-amino acid aminotransferase [Gammaproteobacteria bacterium]